MSTELVQHQVFAKELTTPKGDKGDWITVSRCTRGEIPAVERRRGHYPSTSLKTRWLTAKGQPVEIT